MGFLFAYYLDVTIRVGNWIRAMVVDLVKVCWEHGSYRILDFGWNKEHEHPIKNVLETFDIL